MTPPPYFPSHAFAPPQVSPPGLLSPPIPTTVMLLHAMIGLFQAAASKGCSLFSSHTTKTANYNYLVYTHTHTHTPSVKLEIALCAAAQRIMGKWCILLKLMNDDSKKTPVTVFTHKLRHFLKSAYAWCSFPELEIWYLKEFYHLPSYRQGKMSAGCWEFGIF